MTIDLLGTLSNGSDFGTALRNAFAAHQYGNMQQITDPTKKQEFANNSMFSRELNAQLKSDNAAQQKQALDNQKTQSEIYKNMGSGGKDFADAGNTTQKTANSRLTDAKQAIFAGAQNGNPQFIRMGLDAAKAAGAIDDQTYAQFSQQLEGLGNDPNKISAWAKSAILAGSQNPASFLFQSADNAANNAQSDINNQRTTNASIYSTNTNAQTQRQKLKQNQQQFNSEMKFKKQQAYFNQHKPQQYIDGTDGFKYAVFADGSGMRILGNNGQPIKIQTKNNSTVTSQAEEKTRMDRIDAILPDVKNLLENATNSWTGYGIDALAGAVGKSTDGAKATAQLKTLSGQLVSLMPKMSGPQSDKDVAMYKEMAGNLADPTIPKETRLAALQAIQSLNNKYRSMSKNQTQPQPKSQADNAKLKNILWGH